jgi:hypothetical protein
LKKIKIRTSIAEARPMPDPVPVMSLKIENLVKAKFFIENQLKKLTLTVP